MKEFVKEKVSSAVKNLFNIEEVVEKASFEKPKRKEYGDFATNVAFLLSKSLKKNPREIAEKIADELKSLPEFETVEVAGAGFINFKFSQTFYSNLLKEVKETEFYKSNFGKGQKVLLEYVSANPTGPLHVGHGRGAVVGDVIYNAMKLTGFKPEREFYINDAGRQIKLLGISILYRIKELLGEKVELPEDAYRGEYIKELAEKLLKEKPEIKEMEEEEAIKVAAEFGKNEMLKEIKDDLKTLRVEFDNWFSEKTLHEKGMIEKAIETLKDKGLIYEKEGALWFKSTAFGDDKDRVVKRSNGEYTYFAADIAYHLNKIERGYDKAVNVWGADHHGYVKRVKAAIEAFGKDPNWLEVVLIQLVKLFKNGQEVKMSKRAGNFVTLRWLMEEVGADAVRFFFLLKRHDTPLDFDIDLALSQKSENPVYYVQYAHARLCSILDKAEEKGLKPSDENLHLLSSEEEKELITACYSLRYELQHVAERMEPHRLTYYLIELASKLHKFYNKHKVIDESNKTLSEARLYLISAVKKTVAKGLEIINVNAPRRM